MKALKEKRVSLRSLFRRGLVILSLFALAFAFASCGESGGGGGDPTPTSGPTAPPVPPDLKHVEKLEIRKHPTMYSFEAGAVDLTGLVVAVHWNDNGVKSIEWVEVKDAETAARFYVNPPVGTVTTAGSNETDFSPEGRYTLYYNDLWDSAPGVNLYVPAVRAISLAGTSQSSIVVDGKIPAVYEDQALDVSSLRLVAEYVEIPAGYGRRDDDDTTNTPHQYLPTGSTSASRLDPTSPSTNNSFAKAGRDMDDYAWDGEAQKIKFVPLSPNPDVWRLTKDEDKPDDSNLKYWPQTAGTEDPANAGEFLRYKANVGAIYYVFKLDFKSGTLRPFYADEEQLDKPVDWVKELVNANARFTVKYYTGPNQTLASYEREIGMYEYIKAMHTMGVDYRATSVNAPKVPRATVPVVRGASTTLPNNVAISTTPGAAPNVYTITRNGNAGPKAVDYVRNSILGIVVEEFQDDAVLACYYYYPGIKGERGFGYFNDDEEAGTSATPDEETSGRTWAAAATIPLAGLIYEYDSILAVRKANTETLGNARVQFGVTYPKSFLIQLHQLWDAVWVYVDPNDSSKTIQSKPLDWRPFDGSAGTNTPNSAFKNQGAVTWNNNRTDPWWNQSADPGDEDEVEIFFDMPDSIEDKFDSLDFTYEVIQ